MKIEIETSLTRILLLPILHRELMLHARKRVVRLAV